MSGVFASTRKKQLKKIHHHTVLVPVALLGGSYLIPSMDDGSFVT
jgi:hypothetical protein